LARPPARFALAAAVLLGFLNAACPGGIGEETGGGGAGGTTGMGGTGGACVPTGAPPCDAFNTIFAGQRCSVAGCHGAGGPMEIDLQSPGITARLLGKMSMSAMCGGHQTPYLVPGSNPATGLFMEKFLAQPPCGDTMPLLGFGGDLNPQELECITDWATAVTSRCWTQ
jgi:hypothetical protein